MVPYSDLTVAEFAALTRVSRDTVYRLLWRRALPGAYRVGRQWRISREAVDRLRGEAREATLDELAAAGRVAGVAGA